MKRKITQQQIQKEEQTPETKEYKRLKRRVSLLFGKLCSEGFDKWGEKLRTAESEMFSYYYQHIDRIKL